MKRLLTFSAAVAALLAGAPALAQAQDSTQPTVTEDETEDAIIVTGMRRSMRDALDVKRDSIGIVEVISAQDIGVLPDVTIAETLARLPGLNTVRDRGNDSQAAIRGLGPRMVLGLINGREMASSEPDRNIRWEVFPSEIISGVELYKSSQANLVSGGISGTVDIQTLRPLDYRGPAVTLRAGPVYYEGGERLPFQDQVGYRASGAWVAQVSSELAFNIAGSYQLQQNGYESVGGGGWNNAAPGMLTPGGPLVQNPWGASIDEKQIETTRSSVSSSLQWRPSNIFEGRFDFLVSNVEIAENNVGGWYSDWGNWAGDGTGDRFTNNVVENGSLVRTDMTFDSTYNPYVSRYNQDAKLFATGLNGTWDLGAWTLVADVAYSQAERHGRWQAVRMTSNAGRMSYDYRGELPTLYAEFDAYQAARNGTLMPFTGQADINGVRDTLATATLDAERDLDGDFLDSIEFGVRYADRVKEDGSNGLTLATAAPLSPGTPVDYNLFSPWNYKYFTVPTMIYGDFEELAIALYGQAGLDAINIPYDDSPFYSEVGESVWEAYAQANYATTFGAMPVNGNFGVRIVDVDLSSYGPSNGVNITVESSYTEVLPSFNARLELTDGMFLKLGLSRALSRPPLNDLRVDRTYSTVFPYSGGGGNPYLEPYLADQLDLGFERYFGEEGLFAIAAYVKTIHNYIGFETRNIDIPGIPTPVAFTSPNNAEDTGTLRGVEFTFQTPFSFIRVLENFGVYSNLALTSSDVYETTPADNPHPMNGVAETTAILDFWYADDRLDARLGLKYHSPYTIIFTWNSNGLQTVQDETTMDFSMTYQLTETASVRFQAANLLNTPLRLYDNNNESQIARNDVYGRRYMVDLTLKF